MTSAAAERVQAILREAEPCRLGFEEHDGSRYCYAHGGMVEAGRNRSICDGHPVTADPDGAAWAGVRHWREGRA